MAIKAKWLVVDASLAISAGESNNPTSQRCRKCLDIIADKESSFRVVMTKAIEQEWTDPNPEKIKQIARSKRWLVIFRSRKKVEWLSDETIFDGELREQIDVLESNEHIRRIMLDDIHLVEAAAATDQSILSLDEKARNHFSRHATQISQLTRVIWANPGSDEMVEIWLREGAPPDEQRQLGYREHRG